MTHFCNALLLPGECIECIGKPRPFVRLDGWGGSTVVPIEVIGRTKERVRIRFLIDCPKGARGTVRLVVPSVVQMPPPATPRRKEPT